MSETTRILDEKYAEVYAEELRGLERRMENDRNCTLGDLEGILKHLYIYYGNDWTGRGMLQDTVLSATIAAYEYFIGELKKSLSNPMR